MTKAEKRKLVFFDFVTHFGGAQQCTVLLCEQLNRTEEVHVIDAYGCCRKYVDALTEKDIPIHVLVADAKEVFIGYKGRPLIRMWSLFRQLHTLLKLRKRLVKQVININPDLVWTNSSKALMFLAMSSRLRKYHTALYAHGWYRKPQVLWIGRQLIKYFADFILAVSNSTKKALQSWGVTKNKIYVVFNTIDFGNILESSLKEPLSQPPGIDKGYKILIPAALLITKGQHIAVKAASLLKRKGFDFVMWLVGDDVSVGDKSRYRDYLYELIQTNNLENNVYLLGGRGDVWSLMRLADAVVLPTHTEGLPRVIQEAMILERPVISTPVGGVTDLIIDGQTGLLVPVDDESALDKCLEKCMLDRDFARTVAENGRRHMYDKFNLDRHLQLVKDAFESEIMKETRAKQW